MSAPMLPVLSGQRCVGFLLNRGPKGFEAVDHNECSLGTFETQRAAADAVHAALITGRKPATATNEERN